MKFLKFFLLLFISIFSFFEAVNAELWISPLKFEFKINPGEVLSEKLRITNHYDYPITLYTSTEDFISWDDKWNPKFLKPEDQANPELSLNNWIEIEEKNITLIAWETREINFKVNVPESGEPGWHYWAIFFSPWIPEWAQVAVIQRLWTLILVNVNWDVKIDWSLEGFKIWNFVDLKWFTEKNTFDSFPITFETHFNNNWNVHLKPMWKIELIDEDWNVLEKIWKKAINSEAWAFLWEEIVNYIPINDWEWNVLPWSDRKFSSIWEWFW